MFRLLIIVYDLISLVCLRSNWMKVSGDGEMPRFYNLDEMNGEKDVIWNHHNIFKREEDTESQTTDDNRSEYLDAEMFTKNDNDFTTEPKNPNLVVDNTEEIVIDIGDESAIKPGNDLDSPIPEGKGGFLAWYDTYFTKNESKSPDEDLSNIESDLTNNLVVSDGASEISQGFLPFNDNKGGDKNSATDVDNTGDEPEIMMSNDADYKTDANPSDEIDVTEDGSQLDSLEESAVDSAEESAVDPTEESTVDPKEEGTVDPIEESTVDPKEEGTVDPIEESTVDPKEEGTVDPIEESTVDPIEESTVDPIEENVLDKRRMIEIERIEHPIYRAKEADYGFKRQVIIRDVLLR